MELPSLPAVETAQDATSIVIGPIQMMTKVRVRPSSSASKASAISSDRPIRRPASAAMGIVFSGSESMKSGDGKAPSRRPGDGWRGTATTNVRRQRAGVQVRAQCPAPELPSKLPLPAVKKSSGKDVAAHMQYPSGLGKETLPTPETKFSAQANDRHQSSAASRVRMPDQDSSFQLHV
jgi:hypothetical protein